MFCMRLINNGAMVAGFVSVCCTVDMDFRRAELKKLEEETVVVL